MAAIRPFRHLIVYPRMMQQIGRTVASCTLRAGDGERAVARGWT